MSRDDTNSRRTSQDASSTLEGPQDPACDASVQLPPDGGYGWVVTTCVSIINAHSWGISSAYSVFLAYYLANETFPGGTHLQYASVGSLAIGCTLLISPLVTVIVREFGTRPTMLVGALFQSIGLVCASLSTQIWHLFLSQGMLFGLGMGLVFLPSYGIISQWFDKRRALANGIAISGGGIGGLVYSLSTGVMIRSLGLAWAYRILSIVTAVVNISCTLFIKARYEAASSKQLAFDTSLLKRAEYLLILAFGSLSMLGYFVLIFTLANYANVIGLGPSQGSVPPALFMLGQAFGRPMIGWLSDTVGRINMAILMTLLTSVFVLAVWVNASAYGTLLTFAIIEGLVAGVFWVTVAPIMADTIGLGNLPSGLSLLWLALVLPSTFSEPIAIEIFNKTESYLGAQLFTGFVFIAAAMCMVCLRGWRLSQAELHGVGDGTLSYYLKAYIRSCLKIGNV